MIFSLYLALSQKKHPHNHLHHTLIRITSLLNFVNIHKNVVTWYVNMRHVFQFLSYLEEKKNFFMLN